MSESTERCCGNCRFFVPLANPHEHLPEDSPLRYVGNKQVGACHRYPPAIGNFGWPILVEEDWCGEFRLNRSIQPRLQLSSDDDEHWWEAEP